MLYVLESNTILYRCETMSLNMSGESILECTNCHKEFLFWGKPNEGDEVFCTPECIEQNKKK